jgi:transposase
MGTERWTYNEGLRSIKEYSIPINRELLRASDVYASSLLRRGHAWALRTPSNIRDEAINDLIKAYAAGYAKGGKFEIKPRLRKDHKSDSIVIPSRCWKDPNKIFYAAAFKKLGAETTIRMSKKDRMTEAPKYDCRLQRDQYGHYYFCQLLPADNAAGVREPSTPEQMPRIIALDPGVNTFATGYEPATGRYIEWGRHDKFRLERLNKHLDDLVKRTTDLVPQRRRKHKRYRMNRAAKRIRFRIRNLVDEFHKKLVKWLVDNYELVLWPPFKTKSMIEKDAAGRRVISPTTARDMITWSFYRFKQRLLMKAAQTNGRCIVQLSNEHSTTMTCGRCGNLKRDVGADRVYKCGHCRINLPRDWNAARNIFIKQSTEFTRLGSIPALPGEGTVARSDLAELSLPEMTA